MAEHIVEGKKILRFVNTDFRVTHSTNEDILNIKRKGTPDTTESRNPCVIKVILLSCFTHMYIDIFKVIKSLVTY
jgi:hypothetical protein